MRDSKARDAIAEATGAEREAVVKYQPGRHRPTVWQTGGDEVYVVSAGGPSAAHAGYRWKLLVQRPDDVAVWVSDGPCDPETAYGEAPSPSPPEPAAFVPEHYTLVTTAATLGRFRSKVGARYRDGRRPGARGVVVADKPGYWVVEHGDGTEAGYAAEELAPVPHPPELAVALAALRSLGLNPTPRVHTDWPRLGPLGAGERHALVWLGTGDEEGLLAQDKDEGSADRPDGGIFRIAECSVVARDGEELEAMGRALIERIAEHARVAALVLDRAVAEERAARTAKQLLREAGVLPDPAAAPMEVHYHRE